MPEEIEVPAEKPVEKPAEKISVADAVKNAIQDQAKPAAEKAEKAPAAKPEENILEVSESPEEVQEALKLYNSLKDPVKSKEIAKDIALKAGILSAETKEEKKEAKEKTLDIVKKHLGEENEYLADKLSKALDEILDKEVKKPQQDRDIQTEALQIKTEIDRVYEKMTAEHEDFKTLESKMNELSQYVMPGPKSTIESYFKTLYDLARGEKSVDAKAEKKTQEVVTRITKNAQEARKSVSSDVDETRVTKGSHRPTAREAVLAALQEIQK